LKTHISHLACSLLFSLKGCVMAAVLRARGAFSYSQ